MDAAGRGADEREREREHGVTGQMGTNKESGRSARGSVESYVGVRVSKRPRRSITEIFKI